MTFLPTAISYPTVELAALAQPVTQSLLFDWIRFVLEVLTLIFLGWYVHKTARIAKATEDSVRTSQRMVAATQHSVDASRGMLEEMALTRRHEFRPHVVVSIEPDEEMTGLYLKIRNIGRDTGRSVKFVFSPPLPDVFSDPIKNKEWSLIEEGVEYMPPGMKLGTLIDTIFQAEILEKQNIEIMQVDVRYAGYSFQS